MLSAQEDLLRKAHAHEAQWATRETTPATSNRNSGITRSDGEYYYLSFRAEGAERS
jgi:hypothetical protein